MYPKRLLIAAGVLAFLVGLVAMAPLSWVLKLAPAPMAQRVMAPTGTLWQGSLRLATQSGLLQVSWDSQPLKLLLLTLSADWRAVGTGLDAGGHAEAAPWGYHLQVGRGEVAGDRLSRAFPGLRAEIDQALLLHGVDLQLAPAGTVERASGRLAWGPGQVRVAGRPDPLAVPALRGQIKRTDKGVQLVVDGEAAPGALLASLDVGFPGPGELHLQVTDRAARLVGAAPENATRAPDTVFFELKQALR